jgi:hypothetical protein
MKEGTPTFTARNFKVSGTAMENHLLGNLLPEIIVAC